MNRQQRRQQERLERKHKPRDYIEELIAADEGDGIGSISDRAFFEKNPHRILRMRLATARELQTIEILVGPVEHLPDQRFNFMIIKQLAPGVRARVGVKLPMPAFPVDQIPEHVAQEILNRVMSRDNY